jgi:hypothetical protein
MVDREYALGSGATVETRDTVRECDLLLQVDTRLEPPRPSFRLGGPCSRADAVAASGVIVRSEDALPGSPVGQAVDGH